MEGVKGGKGQGHRERERGRESAAMHFPSTCVLYLSFSLLWITKHFLYLPLLGVAGLALAQGNRMLMCPCSRSARRFSLDQCRNRISSFKTVHP